MVLENEYDFDRELNIDFEAYLEKFSTHYSEEEFVLTNIQAVLDWSHPASDIAEDFDKLVEDGVLERHESASSSKMPDFYSFEGYIEREGNELKICNSNGEENLIKYMSEDAAEATARNKRPNDFLTP